MAKRGALGAPLRRFLAGWALLLFVLGIAAGAEVKRYEVSPGDVPFLGPTDAPVTVIEFLDFQ